MRALIQVHGGRDEREDLASLEDWLGRETRLHDGVARERRTSRREDMGGASDVLVAAVSSGGAVTALAASLGTWLLSRRSRVKIKVTGPGDRSVEVDIKSTDLEALLRTILPEPGDDGSAT